MTCENSSKKTQIQIDVKEHGQQTQTTLRCTIPSSGTYSFQSGKQVFSGWTFLNPLLSVDLNSYVATDYGNMSHYAFYLYVMAIAQKSRRAVDFNAY